MNWKRVISGCLNMQAAVAQRLSNQTEVDRKYGEKKREERVETEK